MNKKFEKIFESKLSKADELLQRAMNEIGSIRSHLGTEWSRKLYYEKIDDKALGKIVNLLDVAINGIANYQTLIGRLEIYKEKASKFSKKRKVTKKIRRRF